MLRQRLGTNPNQPQTTTTWRRRYLLTGGIAVCGICGARLHAHRRSSGMRAYNCQSGPDKDGCGGVTCAAARLDGFVIARVLDHYEQDRCVNADQTGARTHTLESDAPPIPEGFGQLAQQFAEGTLSASAWQVVQAGAIHLAAGNPAAAPSPYLRDELVRQWAALPLERQRDRITAVIEAVVVHPTSQRGSRFDTNRIQLRWRHANGQDLPLPAPKAW